MSQGSEIQGMTPRQTRIMRWMVAVVLLASIAAWTRRESPPPPPEPGRTNLVASRALRWTVPEVRQAVQAFQLKQGVTTPPPPLAPDGNFSIAVVDCVPPAAKSLVPIQFRPWLRKRGFGPPPPANVWMGSVEARSEGPGRTRLSIYQRFVSPTNATRTGQAYLDAIVAELK